MWWSGYYKSTQVNMHLHCIGPLRFDVYRRDGLLTPRFDPCSGILNSYSGVARICQRGGGGQSEEAMERSDRVGEGVFRLSRYIHKFLNILRIKMTFFAHQKSLFGVGCVQWHRPIPYPFYLSFFLLLCNQQGALLILLPPLATPEITLKCKNCIA